MRITARAWLDERSPSVRRPNADRMIFIHFLSSSRAVFSSLPNVRCDWFRPFPATVRRVFEPDDRPEIIHSPTVRNVFENHMTKFRWTADVELLNSFVHGVSKMGHHALTTLFNKRKLASICLSMGCKLSDAIYRTLAI